MLALGPGTSIRDEFELEVPDVFFADGGWGCEKAEGSTTGVQGFASLQASKDLGVEGIWTPETDPKTPKLRRYDQKTMGLICFVDFCWDFFPIMTDEDHHLNGANLGNMNI